MRIILRFCLLGVACVIAACGQPGAVGNDDARNSVAEGWRLYSYGAYDAAATLFARRAARLPERSAGHIEALYAEATVWNLRRPGEDPERAKRLYKRVLALGPETEFAAWSALALSRLGEQGTPHAAYMEMSTRYPSRLAGEEAVMRDAVALLVSWRSEDARKARERLQAFIASHPNSLFLATAHSLLAECAHVLGEPEPRLAEAVAAYEQREADARRQSAQHPDVPFLFNDGESFQIANLAECEVGDFAVARRFYQLFLQSNPTEKRVFHARQSLARMDRVEARLRAIPQPLR